MFLFIKDVPFCARPVVVYLRADCWMGCGARPAGVGPPLVVEPEIVFLGGELPRST